MSIIITVLSDEINKSKEFVRYLTKNGGFKRVSENRESLVFTNGYVDIIAINYHISERGYRHTKLYVDTNSPNAINSVHKRIKHNTRPIVIGSYIKLNIKDDVEFLDFEKEMI